MLMATDYQLRIKLRNTMTQEDSSVSNAEQEKNVAIFFDYENIVYSLKNRFEQKANFDALVRKCSEFGTVSGAYAFADWSMPYMSNALLYALQAAGFDLVFVPSGSPQDGTGPRKNVADLYMVIEVMNTLHTRPEIDVFVLMTGDRDFMPLVNTLKRAGKYVVAIGVDGSSSYYLTQSVDDFYYYSEVEAIYEQAPKRLKGRPVNIFDALVQAVQFLDERDKPTRLSSVKKHMVEILGEFDETKHKDSHGNAYEKFSDFVMDARRRGLVKVVTQGGQMEVVLPSSGGRGRSGGRSSGRSSYDRGDRGSNGRSSRSDRSDRSRTPDKTQQGLQSAYRLLVKAVKAAESDKKSTRSSAISNRMKKLDSKFDVTKVGDGNGKSFKRFGEFVAKAAEDGYVKVSGTGTRVELKSVSRKSEPVEVADANDDVAEAIGLEDATARPRLVDALRSYTAYPVSFLSLENLSRDWLTANGYSIQDSLLRNLLTEAVEAGFVQKITREDGKKRYELGDTPKAVEQFLQEFEEVESAEEAERLEAASPYEALVESVTAVEASGADPIFARVKEGMVEILGEFDEKAIQNSEGKNFSKFKDFILEAESMGLVRLETEGTVNYVRLTDSGETTVPAVADSVGSDDGESDTSDVISNEPSEFDKFVRLEDTEQKQLVLDAIRSYESYPDAFMAILAHCRKVRDDRGVYLASGPLRDLLSEAVRYDLLEITTARGVRPSKYGLADSDEKANDYLSGAPIEETAEAGSDTEEAKSSTEKPQIKAPTRKPEPVAEESRDKAVVRHFVMEALQAFDAYPATFDAIADHCIAERDETTSDDNPISDDELKEAVTAAMQAKLVSISSPYGKRPRLYVLEENEAGWTEFVGEPAEDADAQSGEADLYAVLVRHVVDIAKERDNEKVAISTVKKRMKDEDFSEHKDFEGFLNSAETSGLITIKGKKIILPKEEKVDEKATKANKAAEANKAPEKAEEKPKAKAEKKPKPKRKEQDPKFDLLLEAVYMARAEGGSRKSRSILARIKKLSPDFDVKTILKEDGTVYNTFKEFVHDAQEQDVVSLEGNDTVFEINPK